MFEDEFEEFRARSYSGGFSCRRTRRLPQHRSRTTDQLTDSPSSPISDEPHFLVAQLQSSRPDQPMSAPIRWASQETSAARFRQGTSVSHNRSALSSRLVEVTLTRRKEDSNENWNTAEMRPRLNSAPQRRPNVLIQHRRQAVVTETPTSEKHGPDLTPLSYPMRKIRSFIGLGRKCFHGDEDMHTVTFFKDHGASNGHTHHHHHHHPLHHSFWKAADDFRCPRPTNSFWLVREAKPCFRSSFIKTDTRRRVMQSDEEEMDIPDEYYRILFIGRVGVGKTTIVERLLSKTSAGGCMKESHPDYGEGASCCSIVKTSSALILDGDEATVVLNDLTTIEANGTMTSDDDVTGIIIVYSVEDRKSYEMAIDRLYELRNDEADRQVALILVANKVDLVRTRVISEQEGKSTAKTYDCKYIEVSAAIDHQIDDLLVGILRQVRLVSLQRRQQQVLARGAVCSPMRATRRWIPLERNVSFDHRQNSDTCCLLAAREKVIAKLFTGQRRASKSCISLFDI